MKTSNGTNSNKSPIYLAAVLGSSEPARSGPYFKLKTNKGQQNNKDKSFNECQTGREAKASYAAMLDPVFTSKRADFQPQKKMCVDFEGVKSTYGGGETSFRVSQEVFGNDIPTLTKVCTHPKSTSSRGTPGLSLSKVGKPTTHDKIFSTNLKSIPLRGPLISESREALANQEEIYPMTLIASCHSPALSIPGVIETPAEQEETFSMTQKPNLREQVLFPSVSMLGVLETPEMQNQMFSMTTKQNIRKRMCNPVSGMTHVLETPTKQEEVSPIGLLVTKTIEYISLGAPTRKQQFVDIENHKHFPTSGVTLTNNVIKTRSSKRSPYSRIYAS